MAIYTVHVPGDFADPVERAERTAFVRDGFNVWAFLFGPVFLLRHRAWLAALAWIIVVGLGGWGSAAIGLPFMARFLLLVLLEIFVGLEGNNLRRATLERRGFDLADVVAGARREDSERAFFQAHAVPGPIVMSPAGRRAARMPHDRDGVIGLYSGPEG